MLKLSSVSKSFGRKQVLSDINLEVNNGEIVAVIGSNGSGKTTLFRILAKALEYSQGEIFIDGISIGSDSWRKEISWVDETEYTIDEFSVLEFISFVEAMRETKNDLLEVDQMLKEFGLWNHRFRRMAELSQGTRKKTAIVAALAGHPKLLILDEPTNALDTSATIALKKYLTLEKKRGAIILLSSHILDFVEKISDRVVLLHNGRLKGDIQAGTIDLEEAYNTVCIDDILY